MGIARVIWPIFSFPDHCSYGLPVFARFCFARLARIDRMWTSIPRATFIHTQASFDRIGHSATSSFMDSGKRHRISDARLHSL